MSKLQQAKGFKRHGAHCRSYYYKYYLFGINKSGNVLISKLMDTLSKLTTSARVSVKKTRFMDCVYFQFHRPNKTWFTN